MKLPSEVAITKVMQNEDLSHGMKLPFEVAMTKISPTKRGSKMTRLGIIMACKTLKTTAPAIEARAPVTKKVKMTAPVTEARAQVTKKIETTMLVRRRLKVDLEDVDALPSTPLRMPAVSRNSALRQKQPTPCHRTPVRRMPNQLVTYADVHQEDADSESEDNISDEYKSEEEFETLLSSNQNTGSGMSADHAQELEAQCWVMEQLLKQNWVPQPVLEQSNQSCLDCVPEYNPIVSTMTLST